MKTEAQRLVSNIDAAIKRLKRIEDIEEVKAAIDTASLPTDLHRFLSSSLVENNEENKARWAELEREKLSTPSRNPSLHSVVLSQLEQINNSLEGKKSLYPFQIVGYANELVPKLPPIHQSLESPTSPFVASLVVGKETGEMLHSRPLVWFYPATFSEANGIVIDIKKASFTKEGTAYDASKLAEELAQDLAKQISDADTNNMSLPM